MTNEDLYEAIMQLKAASELSSAKTAFRFDAIDVRFDAIDARFGAIDARFDRLEAKVDGLDHRMGRF